MGTGDARVNVGGTGTSRITANVTFQPDVRLSFAGGAQLDLDGAVTFNGGSYFRCGGGDLGNPNVLAGGTINGFQPGPDNRIRTLTFESASGTFDLVNLPALRLGLSWNLGQLYTVGQLAISGILLGDVNGDGAVNGLDVDPFIDLVIGGSYDPHADLNGDGKVDGLDVAPFVDVVITGGIGGAAAAVPEPSSLSLLLAAGVGLLFACRVRA